METHIAHIYLDKIAQGTGQKDRKPIYEVKTKSKSSKIIPGETGTYKVIYIGMQI